MRTWHWRPFAVRATIAVETSIGRESRKASSDLPGPLLTRHWLISKLSLPA